MNRDLERRLTRIERPQEGRFIALFVTDEADEIRQRAERGVLPGDFVVVFRTTYEDNPETIG